MFDELRINNLLKNDISIGTYLKLPNHIKDDSRIIEHFLKSSPNNIAFLTSDAALKLVLVDYHLVKYLGRNQLNVLFKKLDLSEVDFDKDLFDKSDDLSKEHVLKKLPVIFFSLIDNSKKISKIKEIIMGINDSSSIYYNYDNDVLNQIILSFSAFDIFLLSKDNKCISKYVYSLLDSLSYDSALKLYLECEDLYYCFNNDVQNDIDIRETNGDLNKIIKLRSDSQLRYFRNHFENLRYASKDIIRQCLIKRGDIRVEELAVLGLLNDIDFIRKKLSTDELDKLFSYDFSIVYRCCESLCLLGCLNLDDIMMRKFSKITDVEKQEKVKNLYLGLTDAVLFSSNKYENQKYVISRILYDENIINNNSFELLEKYRNTYDRNLLIQILVNAYGEHVREIFEKRPCLNIVDIENFKIFSRDIYGKLGMGFINYVLNSKMDSLNYLIGKMADDLNCLYSFKNYFDFITGGYEKIDNNIIYNIMSKFNIYGDLIKQIDFNNLSVERASNLRLITSDLEDASICVHSVKDLDNYMILRKKRYVEFSNQIYNSDGMRNLIFSYVTGRTVRNDDEDLVESLSLEKAIKVFNIDNIINDDSIVEKIGLRDDEVSILLLLHELSRISDIVVLKDTFYCFVEKEFDVVSFGSVFDKIKDYFIDDIKKNILTSDRLRLMESEVIEGVEVVTFDGEDFTLLCSVIGLNLSLGDRRSTNKLKGQSLLYDWLYREGGLTTISTALCSSDTEIYPVGIKDWEFLDKTLVFVFDNNIDIIGMGGSDIYASHIPKALNHSFVRVDENQFRFSTMEELKKTINNNKAEANENSKFHSEITMTRKEEDIRKKDGGYKRVMPIGLYVVGDIVPEVIETAKVFNQYYEENGLDKFRIIRVNPKVYKGEGNINFDKPINTFNSEELQVKNR